MKICSDGGRARPNLRFCASSWDPRAAPGQVATTIPPRHGTQKHERNALMRRTCRCTCIKANVKKQDLEACCTPSIAKKALQQGKRPVQLIELLM